MRNLAQMDVSYNEAIGEAALALLTQEHELELMRTLSRYPESIESAARLRSPHLVTYYLHALATDLHAYYNAHQFLVDEENLRNARLNLILAARIVLRSGLKLLGVSAPEEM
jgi:arginyl-tRNA synthetase